ncbi:MAG: hypothetical protein RR144_03460 [Clostridia bacterium]
MKKLNIIKKVMSIICVLTVTVMTLPIGGFVDAAMRNCYLDISAPSVRTLKEGESVQFTLKYSGNVGQVNLVSGAIILNGFKSNIRIERIGTDTNTNAVRRITLHNIQGTGTNKSVTIAAGTGTSGTGNMSNAITSSMFTIEPKTLPPVKNDPPKLTISGPNVTSIYPGQSVTYTANYSDDKGIGSISLISGAVILNGFTANIQISGTGNSRTVTLTNVQGSEGNNKSITIAAGTATDGMGSMTNAATSSVFTIAKKPVDPIVPSDTVSPILNITGPNPSSIYEGETVVYTANYSDDKGIANISLKNSSIILNGFTANIRISGTGNTRTITLSNIRGAIGSGKTISIIKGTASDAAGNLCNNANSNAFTINQKPVDPVKPPVDPPVYPVDPTPPINKPADWIPNPNTGR